ncbi:MAG: UDP-N-acetylmuramoyl-tripeptide--D-alanyl-D-alanine ligase, partial [Cyclobacteriaceae bacterium]|nr:UDP-N-acetylmuramoyl-tripeptide--D-alanyl-D-alanine ligase [Cyclobacteriaceae bacterium HetDA_MAG_MS6]
LRKTGGTPFINGEDQVLSNMTKRFSAPVIFPEKDLQLTEASPYLKVSLGGKSYATELTGAYNFLNIASAVSISRYFDVPDDAIGKAVSTYVPENARSQIIQHDSTTIILDAYNANPDSMQAALINLSNFRGKRVAILGDMKEIENPEAEHKAVVETAADLKIDSIITCGPSMEATKHNTDWFADKKSLRLYLNKQSFADCTVLLKASRSMKFEDLVDSIN